MAFVVSGGVCGGVGGYRVGCEGCRLRGRVKSVLAYWGELEGTDLVVSKGTRLSALEEGVICLAKLVLLNQEGCCDVGAVSRGETDVGDRSAAGEGTVGV